MLRKIARVRKAFVQKKKIRGAEKATRNRRVHFYSHGLIETLENRQLLSAVQISRLPGPQQPDARMGYSVDVSGIWAVAGSQDSDFVQVFRQDQTGWNLHSSISSENVVRGAASPRFGDAISIDGETIAVGVRNDSGLGGKSGAVIMFNWNPEEGKWVEGERLEAPSGRGGDEFGFSVSLSGGLLVVGARLDDDNGSASGSVFIFERTEIGWGFSQQIFGDDTTRANHFGHAVSTDGESIVVGAPRWDAVNGVNDVGKAYVFEPINDTWSQVDSFTAATPQLQDRFASAVAVSGDIIVAGTRTHTNSNSLNRAGFAEVHEKVGNSYLRQATLTKSDDDIENDRDHFGSAVDVSPHGTIVIGAPTYDADGVLHKGRAYVFERSDSWATASTIIGGEGAIDRNSRVGQAVAIDGQTIIVGAHLEEESTATRNTGSVYLQQLDTLFNLNDFESKYAGSFELPTGQLTTANNQNFFLRSHFGGRTLAVDPGNDSLFVTGGYRIHNTDGHEDINSVITKLQIPDSSTWVDLNNTPLNMLPSATLLEAIDLNGAPVGESGQRYLEFAPSSDFADSPAVNFGPDNGRDDQVYIADLMVVNGKLVASGFVGYDNVGNQKRSHFVIENLSLGNLTDADVHGLHDITRNADGSGGFDQSLPRIDGTDARMLAGYMTEIPIELRNKYFDGRTHLTGVGGKNRVASLSNGPWV